MNVKIDSTWREVNRKQFEAILDRLGWTRDDFDNAIEYRDPKGEIIGYKLGTVPALMTFVVRPDLA